MSERIVICGVPKAGKTTLAASMGRPTFHTDDHIALGRERQIEHAAGALLYHYPDTIKDEVYEGVYMAHALRYIFEHYLDLKVLPCDRVIWMPEPRVPYTLKGQHAMAKGVATVWGQVEPELRRRGVAVELGGLALESPVQRRTVGGPGAETPASARLSLRRPR